MYSQQSHGASANAVFNLIQYSFCIKDMAVIEYGRVANGSEMKVLNMSDFALLAKCKPCNVNQQTTVPSIEASDDDDL
jgi:hypothetical protein